MTIAVKITLLEDADTHPSGDKNNVRPMLYVSYVHASTRQPVEEYVGQIFPDRREITVHALDWRDIRISKIG